MHAKRTPEQDRFPAIGNATPGAVGKVQDARGEGCVKAAEHQTQRRAPEAGAEDEPEDQDESDDEEADGKKKALKRLKKKGLKSRKKKKS